MNDFPVRKLFTAASCMVLLASYLYLCASTFVVSRLADSWNVERLTRATNIAPLNAIPWARLGQDKYFLDRDAKSAVPFFEKAVALNPYDAKYWLELSLAYQSAGEREAQHRAIENGLHVDPNTPMFMLLAANSYFSYGDEKSGLLQLHNLIEHDAALAEAAIDLAWRDTHNVELVIRDVTGPNPEAQLMLTEVLAGRNLQEPADQAWSSAIALNRSFDPRLAFPYLQMLLDRGLGFQAARSWQSLIERNPSFGEYRFKGGLVVNTGFEQEILNGGLDWRYRVVPNVQVSIDDSVAHSGRRSLLISSNGAVSEMGISQYVVLQPGRRYKLSGFSNTGASEGAGTLQWTIVDPTPPRAALVTVDLPSEAGWQEFHTSFTAGPQHDLFILKLVRTPAGNIYRGKTWLDDVSITRE